MTNIPISTLRRLALCALLTVSTWWIGSGCATHAIDPAATAPSDSARASACRNGARTAASFAASRPRMAPAPTRSNASRAMGRAKGWRSATKAANRLARPVRFGASAVLDM